MASKRKPTKKRNSNEVAVPCKPDEDRDALIASIALSPIVQAAHTLKDYVQSYGDIDLVALVDSLRKQIRASNDGDLERADAMRSAQAHTLDAIFNNLALRAINAKFMDQLDRYLKLALRAQSQCRATWEALATIKSPPVIGVRQAGQHRHTGRSK
jgi:hypothetical protein